MQPASSPDRHVSFGLRVARSVTICAMLFGILWIASPVLLGQRLTDQGARSMLAIREQSLCRQHLKMLNLAISQYVSEYDGKLPALGYPDRFRKQVRAYRIPQGSLICPFSDKDYVGNKNLAGKKLDAVKNKSKVLLLWSSKPGPDGAYIVLNADGVNRRVSAGELGGMKHASGL